MIIPNKEKDRFKQITQLSVNALNKKPEHKTVKENNFQQVLGGRIQMLIGQNLGQDFFPQESATLDCGLTISRHQMQLYDKDRWLGFSGTF